MAELPSRPTESPDEGSLAQRHRDAMAICSRVFLTADDLNDVDEALKALLDATDATSVFIEVNVDDPDLGPCTSMVREIANVDLPGDDERWSLAPWSHMPESYAKLSRGEPFSFLIEELGPIERAQYEGDSSLSEVDVPFHANGEWVGTIGLADHLREHVWREEEVDLLVAAAEMVGAFWDRQHARQTTTELVAATEKALRYQTALVDSSTALISDASEEDSLRVVLEALTQATGVHYGFVERNEEVEGLGLCSRTVAEVDRTDPDGEDDEYWDLIPWSRMPDSYARLSVGNHFSFTVDDLGPIERALYDTDPWPIASEIDIPIFIEGTWEGLVGFADKSKVRQWTPEEVALLTTIANLIGVHWARARTHEQLAGLVKAKDAFLASVSHELRTPLTVVVGLAAELRDYPSRFTAETTAEFIDTIAQQSADLADMVDDLLVAARTDDDIHVTPAVIDLGVEVSSVVESLGLDHVVVVGTAVAWADPTRFRQIIRNLLTNAQRYGGPNVEIQLASLREKSILRVIDDGAGIDPNAVDALFEPYQIAGGDRNQPDAIGLGLSIARRLAFLMGGDVRYSRQDGRTVFSVAMPRKPPRMRHAG